MRETASSEVRSLTLFLARDVVLLDVEDLVEDRAKVDCVGGCVGDTNAADDAVATAAIRAASLYFTIVVFKFVLSPHADGQSQHSKQLECSSKRKSDSAVDEPRQKSAVAAIFSRRPCLLPCILDLAASMRHATGRKHIHDLVLYLLCRQPLQHARCNPD